MDSDIVNIYKKLCSRYPVKLNSSFDMGFNSNIDFPVLSGTSVLGNFEMYSDDSSFAFYAMGSKAVTERYMHIGICEHLLKQKKQLLPIWRPSSLGFIYEEDTI